MTIELQERAGVSTLAPVAGAEWLHDGSAFVDHDEVLVTSREGTTHGTVPVWFVILPPGVVYLFGRFPRPAAAAELSSEEHSDHGSDDHHSDQGRTGQLGQAA